MNSHVPHPQIVSHCPFCSSVDIHDTNLRALDDASRRLYLVYECRSCTGRFVADRPERIEKVDDETAARVAEWAARILLSYASCPAAGVDICDEASIRDLVRTFVLPGTLHEGEH